jgi:hypothetical protein
MIFAPRSWPSRPGFATRTRIGGLLVIEERVYLAGGWVGYPLPPGGILQGSTLVSVSCSELVSVKYSFQTGYV